MYSEPAGAWLPSNMIFMFPLREKRRNPSQRRPWNSQDGNPSGIGLRLCKPLPYKPLAQSGARPIGRQTGISTAAPPPGGAAKMGRLAT
jgi:hypothetical protein